MYYGMTTMPLTKVMEQIVVVEGVSEGALDWHLSEVWVSCMLGHLTPHQHNSWWVDIHLETFVWENSAIANTIKEVCDGISLWVCKTKFSQCNWNL